MPQVKIPCHQFEGRVNALSDVGLGTGFLYLGGPLARAGQGMVSRVKDRI